LNRVSIDHRTGQPQHIMPLPVVPHSAFPTEKTQLSYRLRHALWNRLARIKARLTRPEPVPPAPALQRANIAID
jgi:hypothetical protein